MTELTFVELEPIPVDGLRATENAVLATALGKLNRVAIGHPLVRRIEQPAIEPLLAPDDLEGFPPEKHTFYELDLSLTLLPDSGCRFRSTDLIVALSAGNADLPLILRLQPNREVTKRAVTVKREQALNLGIDGSLLQVDLGASGSRTREEAFETMSVHLESFGVRSREAGWRLRLTESQEIPLNTTGLRLVCVLPVGGRSSASLRVVAEIDVLSPLDRWVTWAFRRRDTPNVALVCPIG